MVFGKYSCKIESSQLQNVEFTDRTKLRWGKQFKVWSIRVSITFGGDIWETKTSVLSYIQLFKARNLCFSWHFHFSTIIIIFMHCVWTANGIYFTMIDIINYTVINQIFSWICLFIHTLKIKIARTKRVNFNVDFIYSVQCVNEIKYFFGIQQQSGHHYHQMRSKQKENKRLKTTCNLLYCSMFISKNYMLPLVCHHHRYCCCRCCCYCSCQIRGTQLLTVSWFQIN